MAPRSLSARRDFQVPAIGTLVERKQCAALLRPGLGKTTIAQSALLELNAFPALVTAPAQVVRAHVWSKEAAAWEHTKDLVVRELDGEADDREVDLLLGADITVVSYNSLRWLTDRVTQKKLVRNNRYKALVYDELQKMKHPGTRHFMRMRHWAQDIPVVFGLTGSPMGNSWQDLFGEMYAVAGEKPLGPTLDDYLQTYFVQVWPKGANGEPSKYPKWELRSDGSADDIRRRIRPYSFSISKRLSTQELPQVAYSEVHVEVPKKCREMEATLRRELEVLLDSGTTLTALNGSSLQQKIRQFSSGAVYTDADHGHWEVLHDAKLDAIADRVDEMQGAPVLVFTWFKSMAGRLKQRFGAEEFTGQPDQVERWNKKHIGMMSINPQGGGLGQNLQYGSDCCIWPELPWGRWDLVDQGCGRLARLGQPSPWVSATIILAGPLDRRIWRELGATRADEESVVEAVALPGF